MKGQDRKISHRLEIFTNSSPKAFKNITKQKFISKQKVLFLSEDGTGRSGQTLE